MAVVAAAAAADPVPFPRCTFVLIPRPPCWDEVWIAGYVNGASDCQHSRCWGRSRSFGAGGGNQGAAGLGLRNGDGMQSSAELSGLEKAVQQLQALALSDSPKDKKSKKREQEEEKVSEKFQEEQEEEEIQLEQLKLEDISLQVPLKLSPVELLGFGATRPRTSGWTITS